jgi:hypothetical protein
MKLLAMSLEEDARKWYKLCHDNHLASYEAFTKLFKERWMTKKDRKILLIQFNQIKREENGIVKEFEKGLTTYVVKSQRMYVHQM